MFAHLCTIFMLSIEMYDRFNFKLPDLQFAVLSSDAFDPGAVFIYPEEIELLNTRSNPIRKKEFLGVRHLRNQLKIKSPILYKPNGCPYYSAVEQALSISHTKDFIALANARFPIGIDIEQKDRDAAHKQRLEDAKKLAEQLQKLEEETANIRSDIFVNAAKDEETRENRRYLTRIKQLGLQRQQEIAAAEGNEELIQAIKDKYQAFAEQEEIKHTESVVKIREDRANRLQAIAEKVDDINASLIEDGMTRELAQLELKYQREIDAAMGQYDLLEALKAQHEKAQADIQKKYDDEAVKKRKDFQNQIADIIVDAANTTIKNLMDLNDIYDKNDEAAAKRAFERNKSLQIVQAIINTAGGIMGQLNVPQDQLTGANWIKAALIATTGATQIATISAQQFNAGKGGGGAAAPKAPAPPQVSPSFNIVGQGGTNQLLQGIAGQFSQPLRAYVVGGDVTSSQEMERKRIKTATFG